MNCILLFVGAVVSVFIMATATNNIQTDSTVRRMLEDPDYQDIYRRLYQYRKAIDALQQMLPTPEAFGFHAFAQTATAKNTTRTRYNAQEFMLSRSPSPHQLLLTAQDVGARIIKSTYEAYCHNTAAINGNILRQKCLEYFILFDQARLPDLNQFGFAHHDVITEY